MASTVEIIRNIKIKRNFFNLKLKTYKDFYEKVLWPSSFQGIIGREERCEKFLVWAGIFSKGKSFKILEQGLVTLVDQKNLKKEDMKYLIKKYFKDKAS